MSGTAPTQTESPAIKAASNEAQAGSAPDEAPKPPTQLEEDDEFEDFPVEGEL